MDHALAVDLGKRMRTPAATMCACGPSGSAPSLRHERVERDAVDVLHGVVHEAVRRLAVVVDLDRVGMRELAHQAHLALEARRELVGGHVALQDLDRRRTLEERVMREMHRGHAAFRELAFEPVRADAPTLRGPCGERGRARAWTMRPNPR